MISIGNDIVCLQTINAERTQQQKFYSKILSNSEIELFNSTNFNLLSFEEFVWLAWSIKESVYKFEKRFNNKLLFNRTKINIEKLSIPIKQKQENFLNNKMENVSFNGKECFCSTIKFNSKIFYTRSFICDTVIFTVANNEDCFKNIYWGIKKIDDGDYTCQSNEVRKFALKKMNTIFLKENLFFQKTAAGIPFLLQKENVFISLSHHGCFVGYAFRYN